jgi:acyl carrier protein
MEYSDIIKKYIIDNFLFEDDGFLQPDTLLLDSGVIDSTGLLELASFLEESFDITIDDHEFIPENMNSLTGIVSFLKFKKEQNFKRAV